GAEAAWHRWRARQAGTGTAAHQDGIDPPSGPPETGPAADASPGGRWHALISRWFLRFGPPALLLSWLPVVGDPLCAVAGWLRLPFWPCVLYMAAGKCLRYVILTAALMQAWPWVSGWL